MPALTEADQLEVRRLVGRSSFDTWYADPSGIADLSAMWVRQPNAYLVAADILTGLADPSTETMRKVGDVQTDRKGQAALWLEKAREYRLLGQQEKRQAARALMGSPLIVGGVSLDEQATLNQSRDPVASRFGRNRP